MHSPSKLIPCEFVRSVELNAPLERVYAFHGDPHNVGSISPRWQRVNVVEGQSQPHAGEQFEIVVRFFGVIPLRWRGVWRVADAPVLLVDEAITSPFAFWRHEHHFESLGPARTLMTDHVHYLFPGGWLGKWFGETLGRWQFQLMFADRHARTRRRMRELS